MATNSRSKQRLHPPTHSAIVTYWRAQKAVICPTWDKAKNHCWRCARKFVKRRFTEDDDYGHRAHIVPKSLGGGYEPSNFVLLCRRCHLESPDVPDPDFMWMWIRNMMGEFAREEEQFMMALWAYERIYGAFPFPCVGANFICKQFPSVAKQLRSAGVETDDGERANQLLAKNFGPAWEIALHKMGLHHGRASATSMA